MKKFIRAVFHAAAGIGHCAVKGRNFRIQLVAGLVTIVAAILLRSTPVEWMLLLLCIAMVLSLEMINTAVEDLCNLYTRSHHPAIKHIKDMAAGAVLISAIVSFVTGLVIFLPKIITLIKTIL